MMICSSWDLLHDKSRSINQVLINNNFPNYITHKQITKFLNGKMKSYNLTNGVRRFEHQTLEIKINMSQYFNNASEDYYHISVANLLITI